MGIEHLARNSVDLTEVINHSIQIKVSCASENLGHAKVLHVMTRGAKSNETFQLLDKLLVIVFPNFVTI